MSKEYQWLWRKNHSSVKKLLNDSSSQLFEDHSISDYDKDFVDSEFHNITVHETTAEEINSDNYDMNSTYLDEMELCDSSDSDTPVLSDNEFSNFSQNDLQVSLAAWATRNRCTQVCVTELLAILRLNGHSELPKDPRTLLKTPRNVTVAQKCGGEYVYIGIEKGIRLILKDFPQVSYSSQMVDLLVNTDGVPLYKSSNTQLWPILGLVNGTIPFIISIFCGESKPSDCSEFLQDFLEEYESLETSGFQMGEETVYVKIKVFTCDAPARQFMKGVKSHTGFYSCERCIVKGEYVQHRVVFNDVNSAERSGTEFDRMAYEMHQLYRSPLIDSSVDCINDFCLDYMHLVCLGVMKRILESVDNFERDVAKRLCKATQRTIGIEKMESY